jgi:hypothetical protein
MALLHQIQETLLDEEKGIAPVLLKFKFLAAKLGSEPLEDWVEHEMEGYPKEVEVPDYRLANLTYTGNFANSVYQYKNHPIPTSLILQHTSEEWVVHRIREGMSAIDHIANGATLTGKLTIDTSDMVLRLHGKIYEQMTIQSITATFPVTALLSIQSTVRAKLLDLTLELEKRVPASTEIVVGTKEKATEREQGQVTQIFNQTVNGDMTNIASSGSDATVTVNVKKNDIESLKAALNTLGFAASEVDELSKIAADEQPDEIGQPFGIKARNWIASRLEKGVDGVISVGGKVAKKELAEVFQQYYDSFSAGL